MVSNNIINAFDVVGFNAHGGEHEAVCKEVGQGVTLWMGAAEARHFVHP